jgi:hypothetical protein
MIRLLAFCLVFGSAFMAVQAGGEDPKNWTPIRIRGQQKAPEFEQISEWVNSPALTMKELKGKVVVVHFMAFG